MSAVESIQHELVKRNKGEYEADDGYRLNADQCWSTIDQATDGGSDAAGKQEGKSYETMSMLDILVCGRGLSLEGSLWVLGVLLRDGEIRWQSGSR